MSSALETVTVGFMPLLGKWKVGREVCVQYAGKDEMLEIVEGKVESVSDLSVTVGGCEVPIERIKVGKLIV